MSEDNNFPPDCLVLKIEEHDEYDYEHMTNIFILYDQILNKYVVRGKHVGKSSSGRPYPYSFMADTARDLVDFLSFAIDKGNLWTFVLYNYDNLPSSSNEITYEFLSEFESPLYEIAGYNKGDFNQKYLLKNLRMIRNVYNPM